MKRAAVLVALFALPLAASARGGEKTWYFGTQANRTNISFESRADLENIIGSTNQASGSAWTDGQKVKVRGTLAGSTLRAERAERGRNPCAKT